MLAIYPSCATITASSRIYIVVFLAGLSRGIFFCFFFNSRVCLTRATHYIRYDEIHLFSCNAKCVRDLYFFDGRVAAHSKLARARIQMGGIMLCERAALNAFFFNEPKKKKIIKHTNDVSY